MAFLTNVYPPILPEMIPAFIKTGDCKIPYELSPYMQEKQAIYIHISIVDIKTNESVLDTTKWPAGIKTATIFKKTVTESNPYPFEAVISPKDMKGGKFEQDAIYKIQMRFISADLAKASDIIVDKQTNKIKVYNTVTWMHDHRNYFSEWSKACLVKAIAAPIVTLKDLPAKQKTVFFTEFVDVIGNVTFNSQNQYQQECLSHYNIKIYEKSNLKTPVYESEEIYTNSDFPNNINYSINYNLEDAVNYVLKLNYTTNNLYSSSIQREFMITQTGYGELKATISATMDEDRGIVKVELKPTDNKKIFMGSITIRRTSSKSNFTIWEDVFTDYNLYMQNGLNYIWYDKTVQAGVWYHYCAQRRDVIGNRGIIIKTKSPVICSLDDIFLTNINGQLRIRFNPSINEFKYNITESQQIGLGAKYPQIKRNSNNFYRSFPISGLISSFMDTTDWYDPHFYDGTFHNNENQIKDFTSKDKIYGDYKQLYNNYNDNYNITEYDDYIYERKFREKVYDFLYNHDVKLFRSTTEGNILIKLINLDFQPVQSLGRRLYSFSATAVEIDESNLSNYKKYNIQSFENINSNKVLKNVNLLGQLYGSFSSKIKNPHSQSGTLIKQSDYFINTDLVSTIIKENISNKTVSFISQDDIDQYDTSTPKATLADFHYNLKYLKWLRVEFTSEPYLIWDSGMGVLYKVDTEEDVQIARERGFSGDYSTVVPGYVIIINGKQILIKNTVERRLMRDYNELEFSLPYGEIINVGYFELKSPTTQITKIQMKYPAKATIDYLANVDIVENTEKLIKSATEQHKVGQLEDIFDPGEQIIRWIYNKYSYEDKQNNFERILDVIGINIEAAPGTIAYIRDSYDDNVYNKHVLQNGFLNLRDENNEVTIMGLQFHGIQLKEKKSDEATLIKQDQFINTNITVQSEDEVQNPIINGIYNVNGQKRIYYHNEWFGFDQTENAVLCKTKAIINFYFTKLKGVYAG